MIITPLKSRKVVGSLALAAHVWIAASALPACARPETIVESEGCFVISAEDAAQDALIPVLDQFAAAHGLYSDKSHPQAVRYSDSSKPDDRQPLAVLNFRMGFGTQGAVLSLHRFDRDRNESLVRELPAFVARHIEPIHRVMNCDEIRGFEPPIVRR